MANEKSSSWLFLLAPAIALVVFLIAGYFIWQDYAAQKAPLFAGQTTQTDTQSPSANWQTVTDSINGISFQYPPLFATEFANFANTPTIVISPTGSASISNGCYKPAGGNPVQSSQYSANGMNFCFTTSGGPGAGQLYTSYWYTTLHNGNYVTLQYVVHTPNGCGPYQGTDKAQACQDFMNNVNTLVVQPIQQSVATLTFTK